MEALGLEWAGFPGQPICNIQQFLDGPRDRSSTGESSSATSSQAAAAGSSLATQYSRNLEGVQDPRTLTDGGLLVAGVTKVFHRRRILRWVGELRPDTESSSADAQKPERKSRSAHPHPLSVADQPADSVATHEAEQPRGIRFSWLKARFLQGEQGWPADLRLHNHSPDCLCTVGAGGCVDARCGATTGDICHRIVVKPDTARDKCSYIDFLAKVKIALCSSAWLRLIDVPRVCSCSHSIV